MSLLLMAACFVLVVLLFVAREDGNGCAENIFSVLLILAMLGLGIAAYQGK